MTKAELTRRKRSVASAIGSVKAEGLKPSAKTQKNLNAFSEGRISIDTLVSTTVANVKSKHSK